MFPIIERARSMTPHENHPDVRRKAAYNTWFSHMDAAQNAIAALQTASSDPLLTKRSSTSLGDSCGLALDKLCLQLDGRAADLQLMLEGMRRVVAAVGKIRNSSNILIPLHRLPNELLRQIFTYTVGVEGARSETIYRPYLKHLSVVCSLWREICNNTPAFWSQIDFMEGHPYERTRLYVERTQGSCLDVTMDFFSFKKTPNPSALSLVFPSFSRWFSFTLRGPNRRIKERFSSLTHLKDQKALRRLSIHGEQGKWIEEGAFQGKIKSFWRTFPDLTEINISYASVPWSLPILRNLTRLLLKHVQCPSLNDFQGVLSSCPNLKELRLEHFRCSPADVVFAMEYDPPTASKYVDYPHLEILSFCSVPPHLLRTFFATSTVENLVSLCFDAALGDSVSELVEFLDRSDSCSLTSLTVKNWHEHGMAENGTSSLNLVLESCPYLTDLELNDGCLHRSILQSLIPTDDDGNCPELEDLTITGAHCSMILVAAIAKSRYDHDEICSLENMTIEGCLPVEQEMDVPYAFFQGIERVTRDSVIDNLEWDWLFN